MEDHGECGEPDLSRKLGCERVCKGRGRLLRFCSILLLPLHCSSVVPLRRKPSLNKNVQSAGL